MIKFLFKKKQAHPDDVVVSAVVTQTAALIQDLYQQMDLRFKELSAQVKEVELGLIQMEKNLIAKDLKDKQAYGLLHYKLHETKHTKLESEITDLENLLKNKRELLKDQ
jgi:hypothetical protein